MINAVALTVALVFCAATNLLIKAGSRAIEAQHQAGLDLSLLATIKSAMFSPWIIGGLICGVLNLAAYAFALRRLPVSLAYPIVFSVGYAIVVCVAAVWFSERLSPWQMIGVGVILAGVWMVAMGMAKTA